MKQGAAKFGGGFFCELQYTALRGGNSPAWTVYELARKLRKIPEAHDSKLVAVTGYGTKADRKAFEEVGLDHYLPRPSNIEELNRVLSSNANSSSSKASKAHVIPLS
jgi:CheY-like chemotaxis protein